MARMFGALFRSLPKCRISFCIISGGASDSVLQYAQVELGETYPAPIVDLKQSRERALDAFKNL